MSIQLFGLARLGRDAEVRETKGGEAVASLSLAFNYGRKGEDGKKPTQWVDGALWGKQATALAPYLVKGTGLAVTLDDVHVENFTKADGTAATKLAGRVSSIDFAGSSERPAPAKPAPKPLPDDQDRDIPF